MAHYAKHVSFLLLMALSLHTEARESKFFSKVIRSSSNISKNVPKSGSPFLAPAPAPATLSAPSPSRVPAPATVSAPSTSPAPAPVLSEKGYGLYGQNSGEFLPTQTTETTTNSNQDDEFPMEELKSVESYKQYNTDNTNNNNNGGYSNNYYHNNNGGYSNNYYHNNNGGYSNNNYNNNGYSNSYGNNVYESHEKQGMSDTRFLQNGKYYYDVKNENNYYGNGHEAVRGSGNNEGYNVNSESSFEFNTMEEYERQQGLPETQGEYVP